MADDDTKTNQKEPTTGKALLGQVEGELKKQGREAAKGKLKDKVAKKAEHTKAIAQLDREIANILDDFDNGVL